MDLTKEKRALLFVEQIVNTYDREELDTEAVEMFVEAARHILAVKK